MQRVCHPKRRLGFGLALLLACAAPAAADRLPMLGALPETRQSCNVSGWADPEQGAALDILAIPEAGAEVVARLPHGRVPVPLVVLGSAPGWLQVRADTASGAVGWVPSGGVRLGVRPGQGHLHPDSDSRVLIDERSDRPDAPGRSERLLSCQGEWVLVGYRKMFRRMADGRVLPVPPDEQYWGRAWFRDSCGRFPGRCAPAAPPQGSAP